MFFRKKNRKKPWEQPAWRIVRDPHEATFTIERRNLYYGAFSAIRLTYYPVLVGLSSEEEASAWIEREKQRPIIVRTID